MEFKLPDIGEGVHEGEIVKWLVKEGDRIDEDQPLVEVMTDKATVEIPSPATGRIAKLHYKEGDVVKVDSVLVTIEEAGEPEEKKAVPKKPAAPKEPLKSPPPPARTGGPAGGSPVIAMPAVRKLARDLGVDLASVRGTGPGGLITAADIRKGGGPAGGGSAGGAERFSPMPIPVIGEEQRLPLRGVRKMIAHRLQMSKHYAPHFTYVEEADVTDLVSLRNAKKHEAQKQGVKLTYLAYIIKGLIPALKAFPYLNASLDETTQEIVLKQYYNIGIAVATPDGLMVPVIKAADQKSLHEVALEIVTHAEAVRTHQAKPDDLKGSSFTVTSIGSIGGVLATPIINYPDVAILGVNKIVERPMIWKGKIVPRQMLYLSLTLDHRVVDGAVAAEFMNRVVEILQTPAEIL